MPTDVKQPAVREWALVPDESDAELLAEFITESSEHLDLAEAHLLTLETNPTDSEALDATFRAFHTIKGVAGFLGLDPVSRLSHQAENLLDLARKDRLQLAGEALDVTLDAVDHLKAMTESLREFAAGGSTAEAPASTAEVLKHIESLLADPGAKPARAKPSKKAPSARTAKGTSPAQKAPAAPSPSSPRSPNDAESAVSSGKQERIGVQESVRVSAERLDNLIDMIGELVIAETMVTQHGSIQEIGDRDLERHVSLLDKITRELQELGTSLRMVPIRGVFQKMNRLARDLARKSGKSVNIELHGLETEIDKSVVDQIGDPLVHMVRNAIDHGLEANPEERTAAGKPADGKVTLRAFHKGGSVYVEIEDDGRGLDRDRILSRAVERGLIDPGAELSDREVFSLVFEPGFSTAEQVTDISGRGVGMDVVRRNIEQLRGQVEIQSVAGEGTIVSIRLPLTLAIIDGMIVRVGPDRYIVPTLSVIRIVRPRPQELGTVLEKGEYLDQQGEIVPIFRLGTLFEIAEAETDPTRATLLVVEDEGKHVAILVDELIGQQQIVIKSLGPALARIDGVAGGAILSDGRVGLIVDVGGIVRLGQDPSHRSVGAEAR